MTSSDSRIQKGSGGSKSSAPHHAQALEKRPENSRRVCKPAFNIQAVAGVPVVPRGLKMNQTKKKSEDPVKLNSRFEVTKNAIIFIFFIIFDYFECTRLISILLNFLNYLQRQD